MNINLKYNVKPFGFIYFYDVYWSEPTEEHEYGLPEKIIYSTKQYKVAQIQVQYTYKGTNCRYDLFYENRRIPEGCVATNLKHLKKKMRKLLIYFKEEYPESNVKIECIT